MLFWKQAWRRNKGNERRSHYPTGILDIKLYMDHHPHAIIIMSKDGTILRVNRMFESILGFESREVVNRPIFDAPFVPAGEFNHLADHRNKIIGGGSIMTVNIVRITKSGKPVRFIATVYPLLEDKGGNETFIVEYRDISWLSMDEQLLS
ncbi:PAS domain S-box-containing protein [Paenibacillus phyllosphaerae]|uniref:PAS domain S-box-containing protein n=1 Tax=Paenibacillus phyllosphaerae TaxID=274593 RepID=A0A7W5AXT3_9BACL|nr:PAS domain-containing protein [Paenibacillus phyllosphaerae]MBB3110121.1 PAS domain S-box-containing protein [Paenibacillus phyllosphaerae]